MPDVNITADSTEELREALSGIDYGDDVLNRIEVNFHLDTGQSTHQGEVTPPDDPEPMTPGTKPHFALSILENTDQDYLNTNEVQDFMEKVVGGEVPRPSGELSRLYGDWGLVDRCDPPEFQGYGYSINDRGEEFIEEHGHYPEDLPNSLVV